MPRIDPGYNQPKRPPKPAPVHVTRPDAQDPTRTRTMPRVSPDQADRERSPQQQAHDRVIIGHVVMEQRLKALRARGRQTVYVHGNQRSTNPADIQRGWNTAQGGFDYRQDIAKGQHERAGRLAPVISILNQTARPIHAVAGAADAAVTGKSIPHAALQGLENKTSTTFSDVLKHAGVHNKLVTGLGGLGLDIALDPTTYISFGLASPARKAAEAEARKATQAALKAGLSKKAADRAGRAAAAKALAKESNRGVTVGALGKRTSGRTTSRISRAARIPGGSEKLRGALPGRLAQHVAPSLRPAGVTQAQFDRVRAALTRSRALAHTGERYARNRAQAIAKALGGGAQHPQIIDALESRSLAGLSTDEARVVGALSRDYNEIYRVENAAGLIGSKFRDFGYHPRRPLSDLETPRNRRRPGGANLASSKMRTNRKKYAAFRGTPDDIYTQNVPLAYYMRARDSAVKLGRKIVIDQLHSEGKRWHPNAAIPEGHEIYKFPPNQMPSIVEGDELKSLMRGGAPPGRNEYRVLPKALVDVANQSVPQRLEGLEELGRLWDRSVQGRVKTILTVPNSQYHLTNLYGDLFNAYLGSNVPALAKNLGISAAALVYKARREAAAKTLGKQINPSGRGVMINGSRVGLDTLIKEAELHGAIGQGFIGRDLAEVLDAQGKQAAQALGQGRVTRHLPKGVQRAASSRVGSRVLHPIEAIRDVSQYREDAVRLATYLGARKRGLSPDEAAKFTNQHHFDYGDLTQFEKSVLRRVLPFYTFTARNTPLQVRTLLSKPGKYAQYEKVREEALKASGVQPGYEQNLQYYEQQGAPIPVPGMSNLLYPKLPLTDLGRLTLKDQGNYLMAMLTPLIKTPVELNQNYSFFLRKKIDELVDAKGPQGQTVETLKPAPPVVLALLKRVPGPLRKEIAGALRMQQYTDKKTGKTVVGWPARIDYVWRATPATNFASSAGSQIPNTRGQSAGQATFGYLTGLKVVPYSPPDVAANNAGKAYDYLQAVAKKMRHDGTAYDAHGKPTTAYQHVLDQSRAMFNVISPRPQKSSSALSPEAQQALSGLRQSVGSGGGLSPEAEAALAAFRNR